jgi:hypothetical protein
MYFMNPEELQLRSAKRRMTGTNRMSSTANRKAFLNNRIAWYNNKYASVRGGGLAAAPSMRTYVMYTKWKRERNDMNRAARRIQTAVRTVQRKKAATQQMSYLPNFRKLNQTQQRNIMKLAFKI